MPHTPVPAEGGALPAGRLFIEVTPAMRRALELLAAATILVLDEIDGDVDREDAEEDADTLLEHGEGDKADAEPTLGANERGSWGIGTDWTMRRAADSTDECEQEDEHGRDVQDEPHDENTSSSPDLELTANEAYGRGFFLNMGPREDDAEDDDPGGGDINDEPHDPQNGR